MADFFDSYAQGVQLGQQQKQRNQLAELQDLAPKVISGDLAATDRAFALDPTTAKAYQGQQERERQQLVGLARTLSNSASNPQYQAAIYKTAVPYLARRFGAENIPQDWDASVVMPIAQQILEQDKNTPSMGGGGSQNKVVGGALVDPNGQVIYESPVNGQIVNVPDGMNGTQQMIFDPRTRQLSPLPGVGAPAQAAAGEVGLREMMTPSGQPFRVQEGIDPNDLAAAQADMESGGTADRIQLPDRNVAQFSQPAQRLGYTPPKQEATFATLSPEEVSAMGLPVGTIAQRNPNGQVSIVNKPRDLPTGGQVIDNGDGTTTYIPAGKISEGERNASGFYQRMISANDEMRRLEESGYDPTNRRDYYTAGGEFLNPLATPEGQQYRQAQDNWLRANLRKESGAAIGVAEMDQERKNYFPIPGDSPQVIQQKMRNRTVTERAMRSAAGGGLPPAEEVAPERANSIQIKGAPRPGAVEDGYRFRGGDPSDPKNWERV